MCFTRPALLASFVLHITQELVSSAHQGFLSYQTMASHPLKSDQTPAKKGKNSPKGPCSQSVGSLVMKGTFAIVFRNWAGTRGRDGLECGAKLSSTSLGRGTLGWQISQGVGFPHSPHGHLMPRLPLHPSMSRKSEKYKRTAFYLLPSWSVMNTWQQNIQVASIVTDIRKNPAQSWEST